MKEKALLFGKTRSLVGVLTDPEHAESAAKRPGVIILNSGLLPKIGPNRLHVKIARRLAAAGFVAMRFDFSGIGDSLPRKDGMSFARSAIVETQEAMDLLATRAASNNSFSWAFARAPTTRCASPTKMRAWPVPR